MIPFLPTRGTGYDLRFSLLGIPVTVSPFFWVTAALLGWPLLNVEPGGPANLIAWVLCVFLSILLHEFGHALTMRWFGHQPEVVLHHFGGYATFRGRETPGKSLLISAAGPAVQLVLWVALLGLLIWLTQSGQMPQRGTPLNEGLKSLLWINLVWPILNLLPVLPLDGGRILWAILALFGLQNATGLTIKASIGIGVVVAAFFLLTGNFIAGAMFAFMAMENYQIHKGERFGAI